MPIDEVRQVEQLAQQALAAPINNLIIVVALGALVILGLMLFIGYKALPVITRIFTSLTDSYKAMAANIEKLTALEAQSTTTSNVIIDEMRKQTAVIEASSVKTNDTLIVVNDKLTGVNDTLTDNTEELRKLVQSFTELRAEVNSALKSIDSKADCEDVDRKLDDLQVTIVKAFTEQQKRKTDSQPITPVVIEDNAKPDAGKAA